MSRLIANVSADRAAVEVHGLDADPHAVAAQLRILAPSARVRISSGSVRIPPEDALQLLGHESQLGHGVLTSEVVQFIQNRTRVDPGDVAAFHQLRSEPISEVRTRIGDSRLLSRLDDHQARNVAIMTIAGSPGACLFDEQGTGKTLSVVAAFDLLVERGELDVMVIVAPKSMVGEWGAEIQRFCGGMYRVEVLDGARRERAFSLSTGADVYVANYESLLSIPEDFALLCKKYRTLIVADESFAVKNPSAQRTEALARLREWCVRAFALCGTPAPNDAADVVAQVSFVDFGRAFGRERLPDDPDSRRARIKTVIETSVVYTRNLKSTVLPNLPARVHTDVEVALAPRQRALYLHAAGELAKELQGVSEDEFRRQYANFLARRAALLRICSDPAGVDPSHEELPAKFAALDDLLERWTSRGEKVVVWSFYRATLDRLHARYAHLGVARIDGSVSDVATRREAVRSFQESADVRVFLGNPAAAGAGITLHSARIAVYESMSNQAAHYLQSLDRVHRRGQTREVEYLTLACSGTIEKAEYQRLRQKAEMQAELLGDPPDERMSRILMLEEVVMSLAQVTKP